MHNNKQPLRIAVLGTRGVPDVMGGVETHCQALYPRLVAKGHSVKLFARSVYVSQRNSYDFMGVNVIPLWVPKRKSMEAIFHTTFGIIKLVVDVQRKQIDILHIHAIGPALLIPFARLLGIPVVMTHHGPDYDRKKWGVLAKSILKLGEKLGCRFASKVITVSEHIRKSIKIMYGCDGTYIPNGVPVPALIPPGIATAKFGIVPCRYILAVGRLVPEKGFHDLINAFITLDTDWKLVIAGASDHEDSYSKQLKQQASSDPRIVMTGFIKGAELGEILSNAGFFVLPSYHEGLPIALLEAMSYNLPIIASDIPANLELARAKETFPVGDIDTLRTRLAESIVARDANPMTRQRVYLDFNWDLVAEQTERIYLDIVSSSPKPPKSTL